jgi:DNA-binding response OmpR family regulator
MKKILLLEPDNAIASSVSRALDQQYEVIRASSASTALEITNDNDIDLAIVELSLGGHSGFEFLYEFRSYADWLQVPIIVFSTVKLDDSLLHSRSWQALNISSYLYKPTTTLSTLSSMVERAVVHA